MKNENENLIDPFKVYVRVRPLLEKEINQINNLYKESNIIEKLGKTISKYAVYAEDNIVYLVDPINLELYGKKEKSFSYDQVFKEKDDNKFIFEKAIKKLVDNILLGYNSTTLAYGVTGTGKTHTMFGDIYDSINFESGICMYAVDYLFETIQKEIEKSFIVKISYLEIYNEQVIDLLTEKPSSEGIMIVEDPTKGVHVPDLTEFTVTNSQQVTNMIIMGNSRRTMAPTGNNQFSSRSHAILQINIEQRLKNKDKEELMVSKLLVVDLAGSERGAFEKGIRREEGSNINKSLLALGNCINILSDKSKKGSFVPYRDSKLTRLLKDSLGGNISTIMIACVSPSPLTYEETLNTLMYASRANKIQKKVTRNVKEVDPYNSQYREIIVGLQAEISQLKEIIKNQHILLKLKPMESFKEEYGGMNMNMNNITEPFDKNIYEGLSINKNNEDNAYSEDFFNEEELQKIDTNRIADQSSSLNQMPSVKNMITVVNNSMNNYPNQPIIINCNYDVYDNFLNKNLNNLTEEEFEDFEKKMENLYFDKVNLEDKIKHGVRDNEINEKYTIVRTFYEKFIELINDKLIENIEQNMILKFNLKEILELNQTNEINLNNVHGQMHADTYDEEEYKRLDEEKVNIEKNICDNEKEKERISLCLEKNIKIKKLLKKLLFKFISNTQMKEIKDLQEGYSGLLNEKRELEVKNKKYQEFLNSLLKEREEKTQKINALTKEHEKVKRHLSERDKRCQDLERKLRDLEAFYMNDNNTRKNKFQVSAYRPFRMHSFKPVIKYLDDTDIRRSYYPSFKKKSVPRPNSRSHAINLNSTVTNNFISINLNTKIPTVTAFIQGGEIFTQDTPMYSSFANLKNNLNKLGNEKEATGKANAGTDQGKGKTSEREYRKQRSLSKSPKSKKLDMERLLENSENNNKNQLMKKPLDQGNTISVLENALKENTKDINVPGTNPKNSQGHLLKHASAKKLCALDINRAMESSPLKQINSEKHKNCQKMTDKIGHNNLNINTIKPSDAVSISAVTYNNEMNLNSSTLELMENVLTLEGIHPGNQNYNPENKELLSGLSKEKRKHDQVKNQKNSPEIESRRSGNQSLEEREKISEDVNER